MLFRSALGVPAKLRLVAVTPEMILPNAAGYVLNARYFRDKMRRLD